MTSSLVRKTSSVEANLSPLVPLNTIAFFRGEQKSFVSPLFENERNADTCIHRYTFIYITNYFITLLFLLHYFPKYNVFLKEIICSKILAITMNENTAHDSFNSSFKQYYVISFSCDIYF